MENGHAVITSTSDSEAEAFDGIHVKLLSANTVCSFVTDRSTKESAVAIEPQWVDTNNAQYVNQIAEAVACPGTHLNLETASIASANNKANSNCSRHSLSYIWQKYATPSPTPYALELRQSIKNKARRDVSASLPANVPVEIASALTGTASTMSDTASNTMDTMSSMTETALAEAAPMTTTTSILPTSTETTQATTSTGPNTVSNMTETAAPSSQAFPTMSIIVLAMALAVIVVLILAGLGCWIKKRRKLPQVDEMAVHGGPDRLNNTNDYQALHQLSDQCLARRTSLAVHELIAQCLAQRQLLSQRQAPSSPLI